jgi:acetolactate synthase-1/2/3 large subunit
MPQVKSGFLKSGSGYTPWPTHGRDYVNLAFSEADLIIAIGYDFVEYSPKSSNPKRYKQIAHVDVSSAEVDPAYIVNVGVVGESTSSLAALAETATPHPAARGLQFRQRLHDELEESWRDNSFPLQPQRNLADFRLALADDDIVISHVGAHKLWMARLFPCPQPNICIISNGFAAMEVAGPGVVRARLVHLKRRVLAITSDGDLLRNWQELETAFRLEPPSWCSCSTTTAAPPARMKPTAQCRPNRKNRLRNSPRS